MSELLNHLRIARREFAEGAVAAHLEKMGFVGLRPEARETAEAAISATLEEIEAFLRANVQEPTREAEKAIEDLKAEDLKAEDLKAEDLKAEDLKAEDLKAEDLKAEAIKTAAAKVFATLDAIKAHIRASTTEAPEPSAAPQDEQVPPPQDELPLPNFAGIFEQGRFDAEQPVVCPQLLLAFGLLMRHVGAPYTRSKPNQLQRAIQHVGRNLAKGSGIHVVELFRQAHRADIEARRNRLEAKIARDSKPRKPIK